MYTIKGKDVLKPITPPLGKTLRKGKKEKLGIFTGGIPPPLMLSGLVDICLV